MKPILVDNCEYFDGVKSICTKCGRSLPDVCLEFAQMKQKAESYDALSSVPTSASNSRPDDADTSPAPPVKTRRDGTSRSSGRPRKVTNEKNATD